MSLLSFQTLLNATMHLSEGDCINKKILFYFLLLYFVDGRETIFPASPLKASNYKKQMIPPGLQNLQSGLQKIGEKNFELKTLIEFLYIIYIFLITT